MKILSKKSSLFIFLVTVIVSSAFHKLWNKPYRSHHNPCIYANNNQIETEVERASGRSKKVADRIQEAGGLRNFIVDELLKDRTADGDLKPLSQRDPGLEESTSLSPAAKERLRKQKELNETVLKATRSAGMITIASCLALLYLAKEAGLSQ